MSGINHEARAFRAWNVLIEVAQDRTTIRYGALSKRIRLHHRASRYFLEPIQAHCLDSRLPPLTILAVNQSGLPGPGFIAWDVADFDHGRERVYGHNWRSEPNPFEYASDGLALSDLAASLVEHRVAPEEVYAKVKVRGVAQRLFRDVLLRVYDRRCAICGLSFESALEACHLKPWSASTLRERLDSRNGLLLCSNHHRLLDEGILRLSEGWRIRYRGGPNRRLTDSDRHSALDLDGLELQLPADPRSAPGWEYVVARYAADGGDVQRTGTLSVTVPKEPARFHRPRLPDHGDRRELNW